MMSTVNASFEKLLDYEQRSLAFEPGQIDGQENSGEWAGVIFRIGDVRLACNVKQVHEFLPIPAFTPVPGTKPWILGLANVRGDLLTVIDLAWFLNGERSTVSMRTRLLAANLRGRPIGLLVDEVFGQRHFLDSDSVPAQLPEDSALSGFVSKQYNLGSETWQELNLDQLFNSTEFLNGAVE